MLINNQFVIGIHKSGNNNNLNENYGDLIKDVIKDIDKIENIKSYKEENKNEFNYTKEGVIIEKTKNSRKYFLEPYEI